METRFDKAMAAGDEMCAASRDPESARAKVAEMAKWYAAIPAEGGKALAELDRNVALSALPLTGRDDFRQLISWYRMTSAS